jgi:hypothetical protein
MASINPSEFPIGTTPGRDFASVASQLEQVGTQYRAALVIGGLGRMTAFVVPVIVLIVLAAGLIPLPALLLWFLILLIPVSIAWAYWHWVHPVLFMRPGYGQIARWVEAENAQLQTAADPSHPVPPLENKLINAVLLADELSELRRAPADDIRPRLIPRIISEIAAELGGENLGRYVPWKRQGRAWLWAAGSLIFSLIIISGFHQQLARGFSVLSAPGRFVPRQGTAEILNVAPGDATLLAGEPVDFTVRVKTPHQKLVPTYLDIRYADGSRRHLAMHVFGRNNANYAYLLSSAAQGFTYIVDSGGTQSRRYHVNVLPKITLSSVQAWVRAPRYTMPTARVEKLTVFGGKAAAGGSIAVPEGSRVAWHLTLSHALQNDTVAVQLSSTQTLPMETTDGRRFHTAAIPALKSLRYRFLISDGSGNVLQTFPNDSSGHYHIVCTPDLPPEVHVLLPHENVTVPPGSRLPLKVEATDDYGISSVTLELAQAAHRFHTIRRWPIGPAENGRPATRVVIPLLLSLPTDKYPAGRTLRYRFTATDNRSITAADPPLGPQTTDGRIFKIAIVQQAAPSPRKMHAWRRLISIIQRMITRQQALIVRAATMFSDTRLAEITGEAGQISAGQTSLRGGMLQTIHTFPFLHSMRTIQAGLGILAAGDATLAVTRAEELSHVASPPAAAPLEHTLHRHQLNVLDALRAFLHLAKARLSDLKSRLSHQGSNFQDQGRQQWKQLALELKKFENQQRDVINTSTRLAQKPVSQYDAKDKSQLLHMQALADKWSKFLNQKLINMSNLTEQDQANAALKDDLAEMNVQLAMEKDALQIKAVKIATPLEQEGLEDAKKLTSNIEQWLMQKPDTMKWEMEEPVAQNDVPDPPLPSELHDMIGKLLEHEEDMTSDMESLGSKWNDSINKGNGWAAMDGPISDMSAQGVTGNEMPKNDEIQGRSGSGREGRASGEMVGATATNKGGRRTPTRLTHDAFASGKIQDSSKQPPGGATGGGKKAGYSGEGLEGPAPIGMQKNLKRLAGAQAQLLNQTERLRLELHADNFHNFKLIEAAVLMQDAKKALNAFQYHTALIYQKMAVHDLATAKLLAGAAAHVAVDNTGPIRKKFHHLSDSASGPLPKGYRNPIKAYFARLSQTGG